MKLDRLYVVLFLIAATLYACFAVAMAFDREVPCSCHSAVLHSDSFVSP